MRYSRGNRHELKSSLLEQFLPQAKHDCGRAVRDGAFLWYARFARCSLICSTVAPWPQYILSELWPSPWPSNDINGLAVNPPEHADLLVDEWGWHDLGGCNAVA